MEHFVTSFQVHLKCNIFINPFHYHMVTPHWMTLLSLCFIQSWCQPTTPCQLWDLHKSCQPLLPALKARIARLENLQHFMWYILQSWSHTTCYSHENQITTIIHYVQMGNYFFSICHHIMSLVIKGYDDDTSCSFLSFWALSIIYHQLWSTCQWTKSRHLVILRMSLYYTVIRILHVFFFSLVSYRYNMKKSDTEIM